LAAANLGTDTHPGQLPADPVTCGLVRLLIITNDFPPTVGGIENYVFSLARRWPAREVVVLTRAMDGAESLDEGLDFEVRRMEARTLWPTERLRSEAARLIARRRIEAVHFPSPFPPALMGPRLRREHGLPYAVTLHGGEFVLASKVPLLRRWLRRTLEAASILMCESTFVEGEVRRFVGDEPPSVFIPAGVDPERFSPNVPPVFQAPGGGPVILSVSRLVARKGPATLLRAMPRVLERHTRAHLLVVGGGPDRRRLTRMAGSLGLTGAVTFAGPQPWEKVPAFYSSAEVFALPTRERFGGLETEGLPLVYLEAAASGIPAVAGRAGGVSDAVIDGVTGLLVDGRRPEETAAAIVDLLDDPERARLMGEAARRRVLEEFNWEAVSERYRESLDSM
jgi:phosphatidylinositol alpha-1,6-mannosyltransferase